MGHPTDNVSGRFFCIFLFFFILMAWRKDLKKKNQIYVKIYVQIYYIKSVEKFKLFLSFYELYFVSESWRHISSLEPVRLYPAGGFLRASTKSEEEKAAVKAWRADSQDITGTAGCDDGKDILDNVVAAGDSSAGRSDEDENSVRGEPGIGGSYVNTRTANWERAQIGQAEVGLEKVPGLAGGGGR